MSFQKILAYLDKIFEENAEKIRQKQKTGQLDEILTVPNLSGPTGIGKTACVKQFAESKGFELVTLDLSYQPTNFFIIYLYNAINRVQRNKAKGVLLLLDNFNEADEEAWEVINQYCSNFLDTSMKVAKIDENGELIEPVTYQEMPVRFEEIPETVFIVGEQRES